ncbi:MAG TPA: sigma-70 family RNA polymerase sigma factor [Gemmataceae bacterium]|nr:sigma-70 family RNA polymerase sigma factor [Gemmataceae bacterium]
MPDPTEAEELFRRHAARLARLAEQHLDRRVAARVDGEDVVQSVFRTFFRRCARGEFHIDSSADVWRLLVRLTLRKARAEVRRHRAAKRDATAEAPADALDVQALSRDPGPDQAAELVDHIDRLLRGLPDLFCHILDRRLQGCAVADIAAELAVSRQTVYRALDLLRRRLEREDAPLK